ncbi:unnamed protein product, partial [Vitis vinifera]
MFTSSDISTFIFLTATISLPSSARKTQPFILLLELKFPVAFFNFLNSNTFGTGSTLAISTRRSSGNTLFVFP